jgi:hypothetical protein
MRRRDLLRSMAAAGLAALTGPVLGGLALTGPRWWVEWAGSTAQVHGEDRTGRWSTNAIAMERGCDGIWRGFDGGFIYEIAGDESWFRMEAHQTIRRRVLGALWGRS